MSGGFEAIGSTVRRVISAQKSQGVVKVKQPKWKLGYCPMCELMSDRICPRSLVCRGHCPDVGACDVCRPRAKV